MTVFLAQMVFIAFLGCVTMQGLRCSLSLPMFRSLYVCLLVTKAKVSPTKNSWTDQDVICVWTHVGPRNCVSGGGLVPPGEGAISGGHLLAVARYREYLACGQYSRHEWLERCSLSCQNCSYMLSFGNSCATSVVLSHVTCGAVNSDSVTVFKSRLKTWLRTFLFSRAFSLPASQ